jgi:hypothetical protein
MVISMKCAESNCPNAPVGMCPLCGKGPCQNHISPVGQDLRLRQQLVMTPQLQQAIKILQLSLPELEAVVQTAHQCVR